MSDPYFWKLVGEAYEANMEVFNTSPGDDDTLAELIAEQEDAKTALIEFIFENYQP